jgi:hypothetical protein
MRFSVLSTFAILGVAIAAPADLAALNDRIVQYNLKRITDSMSNLDGILARRPSARADRREVEDFVARALQSNSRLITELRDSAADISRGPLLNQIETNNVMSSFSSTQSLHRKVADGWIAIKRDVSYIGKTDTVRRSIQDSADGHNAVWDALLTKYTASSINLGRQGKRRIGDVLQSAVKAYY